MSEVQVSEVLSIADIMRIFHIAQPTVYRWVTKARRGESQFPLPIGGHKQKLCWSRAAIANFQNGGSTPPPKPESAKSRQKRHAAACQSLKRQGVNIKTNHNES